MDLGTRVVPWDQSPADTEGRLSWLWSETISVLTSLSLICSPSKTSEWLSPCRVPGTGSRTRQMRSWLMGLPVWGVGLEETSKKHR